MCFTCDLKQNTLVIQFSIYSYHKQYTAIEYQGEFTACLITIIVFPFLEVLYWKRMPSLGAES